MSSPALPRERLDIRDVWALVGLVAVGISFPLFLAAAAGAIGLPSNDDWVYMRAANSLFGRGVVDMPEHTASAIGQIVLVQPFLWLSHGGPWAFMAFGLTMASIGIASTYLLARCFVGIGSAIFVVLLLIAFPGFTRTSATFMTDVPAYALVMLSLLLGARWLQGHGGRSTLVASLAVGVYAVSIREFAVAAPLAVLIAAWAQGRPAERAWLVVMSVGVIAGLAVAVIVSRSVSGHGDVSSLQLAQLKYVGPAFATFAAVLLPASLLYMGRHLVNFKGEQIVLGVSLVLLVLLLAAEPFLGNLWQQRGVGGNSILVGDRPVVIGTVVWRLSSQIAILGAILAAAIAVRWSQRLLANGRSLSSARSLALRIVRGPEGLLGLFLIGYAAELILYSSIGRLFDRYLYPMVPVAAILILREVPHPLGRRRSHALAYAAFAWLVGSSIVLAANSFAYDAARYRAGETAVAMGYAPETVDAGYEWVGMHAVASEGAHLETRRVTWWEGLWPSFRACAIVSNSPREVPNYQLVHADRSAYRKYLFFGPAEPLYLYGAVAEGCPAPRA